MSSTTPDSEKEPTHFEVLSISARNLDGQDPTAQADTVKRAYRRALLKHHPDKQAQGRPSADDNDDNDDDNNEAAAFAAPATRTTRHFTIDQITEAYTVLSDAQQRRRYTRTLRQQHQSQSAAPASREGATKTRDKRQGAAAGGVETVDLEDLSWSGKRRSYYRACQRCGKTRGFTLHEDDVEDEVEDVELIVECSGCDNELTVIVPAIDGTDSEEDQGVFEMAAQQSQAPIYQPKQENNNGPEPQRKSRGWGLRLGLGLGLGLGVSLGGGGSARAGSSR